MVRLHPGEQFGSSAVTVPRLARVADSRGTFVLGLGAQKSGTTWLSEYLGASPQYDGGFRKEYHVLDIVHLPDEKWLRQRLIGLAGEALEAIGRGEPADPDVLHRAAMVAHQDRYYDYFAGLLDGTSVLATGDHTPSHALLPAARLLSVREQMALRGVRTAAVFVMRDPVERIWSQIRMRLQRSGHPSPSTAEEVLLAEYDRPMYATRSRYEQTLKSIDEVFDPAEVYLGFYESLFTAESTRALCDLVGIDHHPPDIAHRSNATRRDADPLSEATERSVARHYAAAYEAVAQRFPEVDLEALWPSARHVL